MTIPPFFRFILRRIAAIGFSFLVITTLLYGFICLTPPETRATLYLPRRADRMVNPEAVIRASIEKYHLDDPFPIQYVSWLGAILRGEWGYSPLMDEDILPAISRRAPATIELLLYSMLLFIPLGMISGASAGWKHRLPPDSRFRTLAFIGASMPVIVLGPIVLAVLYIALHWFPPERIAYPYTSIIHAQDYVAYTGLLTIDSVLNGEYGLLLESLRHLVMPVLTLSFAYWAIVGRVTRAAMVDQKGKEYIQAGKAHGLSNRTLLWKHAFRNVLAPALTSSALSAANLFTGTIVVERVFSFRGISDFLASLGMLYSGRAINIPDAPAVMGFSVYSILIVLAIMFVLDITHALIDPRLRQVP